MVDLLKSIYFGLCWLFVAALWLSPVAVADPSLLRFPPLQRAGSRAGFGSLQHVGAAVITVALGLSCSAAGGIFPDQ